MSWTQAQSPVSYNAGSSGSAQSVAYGSPVTAGNLLIAVVGNYNSLSGTVSLSDTLGNTWIQAGGYVTVGLARLSIWYAVATGSGADTVTVTPSGTVYWGIGLLERSGNAASSPLRVAGSGATGTSTTPTPDAVAALAGDLVIGAYTQDTALIASCAVAAPFTMRVDQLDANSFQPIGVADDFAPAGTEAPVFTTSSSVQWGGLAAAFRPAAGGVATDPAALLMGM
jgi:hypothetical protein